MVLCCWRTIDEVYFSGPSALVVWCTEDTRVREESWVIPVDAWVVVAVKFEVAAWCDDGVHEVGALGRKFTSEPSFCPAAGTCGRPAIRT